MLEPKVRTNSSCFSPTDSDELTVKFGKLGDL